MVEIKKDRRDLAIASMLIATTLAAGIAIDSRIHQLDRNKADADAVVDAAAAAPFKVSCRDLSNAVDVLRNAQKASGNADKKDMRTADRLRGIYLIRNCKPKAQK